MGLKTEEALDFDFEGFLAYLRSKTRVFMDVDEDHYYITHTDGYWRVQDCDKLNDKGRFSDCSELVTTMPELIELPWREARASMTCSMMRSSTSRTKRAGSNTQAPGCRVAATGFSYKPLAFPRTPAAFLSCAGGRAFFLC